MNVTGSHVLKLSPLNQKVQGQGMHSPFPSFSKIFSILQGTTAWSKGYISGTGV